jgi:hypothetical protein
VLKPEPLDPETFDDGAAVVTDRPYPSAVAAGGAKSD